MLFVRRFSYPLLGLLVVLIAEVVTWQQQWKLPGQVGTLVLAAILIIYWVAARRGSLTPADPEKKLRRSRGGQRPVVLHFYSDHSLGCLLRRPQGAALERTYRGRCEFIYVDVGHREAAKVMESLKADLGDWLFFDRSGKLVGHQRSLSAEQLDHILAEAS